MSATLRSAPQTVLERLHGAQNQHDLEGFVGCFALTYQSEQPVHPDRTFHGNDQVRKNWETVFREMPDFHATLVRSSVSDDAVWAEWHWTGTQVDGRAFDWRGVTIFGVRDGLFVWGRLYMEAVETTGAGIDAAVYRMTHPSEPQS